MSYPKHASDQDLGPDRRILDQTDGSVLTSQGWLLRQAVTSSVEGRIMGFACLGENWRRRGQCISVARGCCTNYG